MRAKAGPITKAEIRRGRKRIRIWFGEGGLKEDAYGGECERCG